MKHKALLEVKGLTMHFPIRRGLLRRLSGYVRAVDGVSFELYSGETLGLVGESGCGKTTVGRTILRLYKPTAGSIHFSGMDFSTAKERELRPLRRKMQMIFQDSYSSLTPRLTVGEIIAEPMIVHNLVSSRNCRERVEELLHLVRLDTSHMDRFPHEFSGGQRQRIGIARALSLSPELIVCDEPIAALDVSIQAQIVNLLEDLQAQLGLTYLFIAHDLSMVRHISARVAVMYLGKFVELADCEHLYGNPMHPYTMALLSAVPIPDPLEEAGRKRLMLNGDVPSPAAPPSGCRFRTRCPFAFRECGEVVPPWVEVEPGHFLACLLHDGGKTKREE